MPELDVDGIRLYYEVRGEGVDDDPVLLLNGVLMTTESWAFQTDVLESRYRVILHDFRGQLKSPLAGRACTFERQVEDLAALLDHLEIASCHLAGTSYGGEVGLLFAATHPERVRSLAVIASVSRPEPLLIRQVGAWAEKAVADRQALYRFMAPDVFSREYLARSQAVIALGEARLAEARDGFFDDFRQLVAVFSELDLDGVLGAVTCPTLIVAAGEDALKGVPYSRAMAAAISDSELLIVPGAGHAVILEKPGEVNTALLGFLEKHRLDKRPKRLRPSAEPLGPARPCKESVAQATDATDSLRH